MTLKEDEEQARGEIERAFEACGPGGPVGRRGACQIRRGAGPRPHPAGVLLREKRLARVNDDLVFHRSAIDKLRESARRHENRSASTSLPLKSGPASRGNTRFRCWNFSIASTSPAAKATNASSSNA